MFSLIKRFGLEAGSLYFPSREGHTENYSQHISWLGCVVMASATLMRGKRIVIIDEFGLYLILI